jgi:exopolysaccharide production protein ExoQ
MPFWYDLALCFFILSGQSALGFIDRVAYGEWEGKAGDKITQGLTLLLIISCVLLIWRGARRVRLVRMGASYSLFLVVFLFCSTLWSIDPMSSLRWSLVYLSIIAGSIGIAAEIEAGDFMDRLALMGFFTATASLLVLAVSPTLAYGGEGDFRGIFSQKNLLGQAMVMGALGCLHNLRTKRHSRIRDLLFLCTTIILTIMSHSTTSLLTIAVFCGIDLLMIPIRKGGGARILGLCLAMIAGAGLLFFLSNPDALLEMMGKDPTLTGRTAIWAAVTPYIYERFWLGWGFIAFWSPSNPAAMEIATTLHWYSPQAHNGILEIMVHLGFIGAVIFTFLLLRTIVLSIRCFRTSDQAIAITCFLSCIGIILNGVSETVLIVPVESSTAIFFIIGFFCEKLLRTSERRRHSKVGQRFVRAAPVRA